MKVYETIFRVTETCNNGNERRIKKSVFTPCFKNGRHVIEIERIAKAEEILKAQHYYDIEYLETKFTELLVTDTIEA